MIDLERDSAPEIDGRLYHFGVVVRDIDAAMATFRTLLGVASFRRVDTNYPARYRLLHHDRR